jgi:hypothetical protein
LKPTFQSEQALWFLLSSSSRSKILNGDDTFKDYDIFLWYRNEVCRHFVKNFRPVLLKVCINTTYQLRYQQDGALISYTEAESQTGS